MTVLMESLATRAAARRLWPELGFFDQAAVLLLERLVQQQSLMECIKTCSLAFSSADDRARRRLIRSQWFDRRCQLFFDKYPTGMCIDIGTGLNTRFHRLCSAADWPRFHWADVDTPTIVSLTANLLPPTDNYRRVAADISTDDWLSDTGWRGDIPLIISFEGVLVHWPQARTQRILAQIAQQCTGQEPVEVIFDQLSPVDLPLLHWRRLLGSLSNRFATDAASRQSHRAVFGNPRDLPQLAPRFRLLGEFDLCRGGESRLLKLRRELTRGGFHWRCAHLALDQRH